jgi:hypothetical protein
MSKNESPTPLKKYRYVFTSQEDQILQRAIEQYGTDDWDSVATMLPGRSARQCRERWLTYLDPEVNRTPWTSEEDGLLFDVFQSHGPRWGSIVGFFLNRTQNNIKNRYNTVVRKARALGLDYNTRKTFIEAGQKITSRSTTYTFESTTPPSPQPSQRHMYSLENLLN